RAMRALAAELSLTRTPDRESIRAEATVEKVALKLADIFDQQEREDGRVGGAVAAYRAGVDMTIDFWNRMALAAIRSLTPETPAEKRPTPFKDALDNDRKNGGYDSPGAPERDE